MKDKILELIAGGEFELAKALIESQEIEFDWEREIQVAAQANNNILGIVYVGKLDYAVQYLEIDKDSRDYFSLTYFSSQYYEVLQFALTWKGGNPPCQTS